MIRSDEDVLLNLSSDNIFIRHTKGASPRLVSKLSRDIHNRIIKLNQLIWPHILNQNQPFGEVGDSAFIDTFCLQP
jgi:hypothetical protein